MSALPFIYSQNDIAGVLPLKPILLSIIALSLIGCGDSSSNSSPTNTGSDDTAALIAECENSGCTLNSAITTPTFTVSSAPITLTTNASITLE